VIADELRERFAARGYVAGADLATALELAIALEKPLLVEGPAGVGKTESAKVLAEVLERRLIRLQCYEGLDAAAALYEWNYPKQLLRIRLTENDNTPVEAREAQIFSEQFLLRREVHAHGIEQLLQQRLQLLRVRRLRRRRLVLAHQREDAPLLPVDFAQDAALAPKPGCVCVCCQGFHIDCRPHEASITSVPARRA